MNLHFKIYLEKFIKTIRKETLLRLKLVTVPSHCRCSTVNDNRPAVLHLCNGEQHVQPGPLQASPARSSRRHRQSPLGALPTPPTRFRSL